MSRIWTLSGLSGKEIAKRTWQQINEDDIFGRAAQLSYYFLLALFPLLLFLTTLLGYLAESGTQLRTRLMSYLGTVMPYSALELVQKTIDEVTINKSGGKLSFGLLAALWAASNGMTAITETLNVAYDVKETRPWWKVRLVAISLTVMLAVMIVLGLATVLFRALHRGGSRVWQHFHSRLEASSVAHSALFLTGYIQPCLLPGAESCEPEMVLGNARLCYRGHSLAVSFVCVSLLPPLFQFLQCDLWLARGFDCSNVVVLFYRSRNSYRR